MLGWLDMTRDLELGKRFRNEIAVSPGRPLFVVSGSRSSSSIGVERAWSAVIVDILTGGMQAHVHAKQQLEKIHVLALAAEQ